MKVAFNLALGKILVVDDDLISAKVLQKFILELGYELDVARDGRSALNLIYTNINNYEALFVDLDLPDMNGIELLQEVRKNYLAEDKPVFILTGYSKHIEKAYLKQGANLFLTKPVNKETISYILKNFLNS